MIHIPSRVTAISKTKIEQLKLIFPDEKSAKQVLNAAKRVSKKRAAGDTGTTTASPAKKKQKFEPDGDVMSPSALEESLALPESMVDESILKQAIVYSNRAPLVLAFAVTLLKYTMPEQPLSSRLSLAQAVVSANSRTKALSLGLESGKSAEDEGWGEGQPVIKVMGREIRVLRRWGYVVDVKEEGDTQESVTVVGEGDREQPLWALDLEAMKKNETVLVAGAGGGNGNGLPIYAPQSARAYLGKSFDSLPDVDVDKGKKKQSHASKMVEKEHNLALLLGALDLVFQSWVNTIEPKELDRRAWNWYVRVRPEVESGVAGWGGKGNISLAEILKLRRDGT